MSSWGFSSQFFFRPSSKVPMAPRSLPPPSMKSPAGPRWRMPCWRPSIIPRMKMCSLDEEFSHFRGHNSAWKNGGFAQVSATEMVRWIPVFVEYCGCPMNVKNKHVSTVIVVPPCSLGGRLALEAESFETAQVSATNQDQGLTQWAQGIMDVSTCLNLSSVRPEVAWCPGWHGQTTSKMGRCSFFGYCSLHKEARTPNTRRS